MTHVEASPNEHTESVSRVLAALTSGTSDGAIEPDRLREALESEGQSLVDLPEVGLFLALSQISLAGTPVTTADDVEIDLRVPTAPAGAFVDPVEVAAVDDPVDVVEAADVIEVVEVVEVVRTPPAAPVARADRAKRARWRRARRVPDIVATPDPAELPPPPDDAVPVAPVPETRPVPVGASRRFARQLPAGGTGGPRLADRLRALDEHLAEQLAEPLVLRLGDPSRVGTATIEHPVVDPLEAVAFVDPLLEHLRSALAEPVVIGPIVTGASGELVGTAVPEPYWPPALRRSIVALDAALRDALADPLTLHLGDGTIVGDAPLDPYWPPATVRRLRGLDAFLRAADRGCASPRVPASRLAGTTNHAVPDAYWPQHLVRDGVTPTPLPAAPRSADELESELQRRLDAVSLIGEADLDDVAAEMQIVLARLVRIMPLDRLGRLHPATLGAFLVRHTVLHPAPADFDATIPVTALRRTNSVGLAFSEALVRLGKPVFREVEQRDEFDSRVRYLRRMQLHGGISGTDVPAVLDAVLESHWAGAASGREVALDWLAAARHVAASTGDTAFRLLTCTDHGARMLEALLCLVRERFTAPDPTGVPSGTDPLPAALVAAAWAWLASRSEPTSPWGEQARPRVRLADDPGDGPEVVLPRSTVRWHLNGELLTYGSPTMPKSVALPMVRSGRWNVTTGTSRRSAPLDIAVQSAADDRVVLVFDERGRHHHHALPLGGSTATVIAPAGSQVDGELDRTLLVGRWVGFERIRVALRGRTEITISQRGRQAVTFAIDPALGAAVLPGTDAAPLRLVFRGHVPPAHDVEVVVADGTRRSTALLSDPWIDDDHGAFGLAHLPAPGPRRPATLTVLRGGFPPSVHEIVVPRRDEPAHGEAASPSAGGPTATGSIAPLTHLLQPLVDALAGRSDAGPWAERLAELDRLGEWTAAHRRPLRQWRSTHRALDRFDTMWTALDRPGPGRDFLPLLAAALIAAVDGPQRATAAGWLDDARAVAPSLTDATAALAASYAEIVAADPPARFRPLPLDLPRP